MNCRYQCDQCGACCKGTLIVEADLLDFEREPMLKDCDPQYREKSISDVRKLLADETRAIVIACGLSSPCSMLQADNRCAIYPTRPNACVALDAGDEQCQIARDDVGLPRLEPIEVKTE